jgi:glucosamine--fructose-6-phosphate aminotransferase (isomerizing)
LRHDLVAATQLVLELEALRPQPGRSHADLDLVAVRDRRAEVDLGAGEDHRHFAGVRLVERAEAPQKLDSRRLDPGQVDGIVHVPHRVEIAEARRLAVHERVPVHAEDGIDGLVAGDATRAAIFDQPEWLRGVPTDRRLPDGLRIAYTGCGTSFHAAQTGGEAYQALEVVLAPPDADLLVLVSHEGDTPLSVEAAQAFRGPKWLVTGKAESPLGELCDEIVVATPAIEQSWCHTASYTCAVATLAALRGEDVSQLPDAVERALGDRDPLSGHERWLVAGAGRDWPTAQEAVLKLREGAFVAAEAHHTEQLLHGYFAAIDERVRCFVLEGAGRAAERAREAAAGLRELGCDVTVVPTTHPVVDIVRFQLLTLELAEARGVNPDRIRRDDERWERARAAYR